MASRTDHQPAPPFRRLGPVPDWGTHFYGDRKRSGGALIDLHIHDVDFIRWCFGDPETVSSTGSADHVTTSYRCTNGPRHITAEGGWIPNLAFEFRMQYLVVFTEAIVEYDSRRDPPLSLTRDHRTTSVPLDEPSAYEAQARHVLNAVRGESPPGPTLYDAESVARLLEAEQASLEAGAVVRSHVPRI